MEMAGRGFSGSYRFGYQGSEKDNEVSGDGNSYTTEFRQLDPRLGRWYSVDPVFQPWQSPYTSMDNNPIGLNDPMGDTPPDKGGTVKVAAGKGALSAYRKAKLLNSTLTPAQFAEDNKDYVKLDAKGNIQNGPKTITTETEFKVRAPAETKNETQNTESASLVSAQLKVTIQNTETEKPIVVGELNVEVKNKPISGTTTNENIPDKGVFVTGEWQSKPDWEITSVEDGGRWKKLRINPGGRIGIGIAEQDIILGGKLKGEILAKKYVDGVLVEQKVVTITIDIKKTVAFGVGFTVKNPITVWYNRTKSVIAVVKAGSKYVQFEQKLEQIAKDKIAVGMIANLVFLK